MARFDPAVPANISVQPASTSEPTYMSAYYPPLDTATVRALEIVQTMYREDPEYLAKGPYSSEVIMVLANLMRPTIVPVASHSPSAARDEEVEAIDPETGKPVEVQVFEGLRQEIKLAYLHLKAAKNDPKQDKVAWAKNAINLLEKLVKLDAQSTNIEMVGNFQREIINILEEVCDERQIAKVMERIDTFITPNADSVSLADIAADSTTDEDQE